ncbi:MAG: 30S ribosomal protein S9, partial [Anaerolineales bacterium]|nr:30S ribosomal protein S9 [Anaerolineales bacterium]
MAYEGRQYYEGVGRRKRATARVRIYIDPESTGSFMVNGKDVTDFFPRFGDHTILSG